MQKAAKKKMKAESKVRQRIAAEKKMNKNGNNAQEEDDDDDEDVTAFVKGSRGNKKRK